MVDSSIAILMATYNGKKYLKNQIESIVKQTVHNWRLYIRDDGSTDGTLSLLGEFETKYPKKIHIINDDKNKLGSKGNFNRLLMSTTASYYMFCDQDDVWLSDKIKITSERMYWLEKKYGCSVPILVHTDLKITDDRLHILSKSFAEYQRLKLWKMKTINRLMVQNAITGATVIINNYLKELSVPIPEKAVMHDWWIGLVASAMGIVDYIDTPTVLYRQHGVNVVGAVHWNVRYVLQKLFYNEVNESFKDTIEQAKYFYQRYKNKLPDKSEKSVKAFFQLERGSFFNKIWCVFKYRFFKSGFIRNIGFFAKILFHPKD